MYPKMSYTVVVVALVVVALVVEETCSCRRLVEEASSEVSEASSEVRGE